MVEERRWWVGEYRLGGWGGEERDRNEWDGNEWVSSDGGKRDMNECVDDFIWVGMGMGGGV